MSVIEDIKNKAKEISNNLSEHGEVTDILFGLKFKDGHTHIHYPEISDSIVKTILEQSKIEKLDITINDNSKDNRKIIFSHRRALGDALMFSAGIRDFKLLFPEISINVNSNQPCIWENNPYIDTSLKKDDSDVEYYKIGYPMVGNANNTAMHFSTMFLFDMISVTDLHHKLPIGLGEFCSAFSNGNIGDPALWNPDKVKDPKEPFISLNKKYNQFCKEFVRQRGDIHLSEKEKKYSFIKDSYWVVAPGGKRDCTAKIWDWRKFQKVIDYFDGRIKFVIIGKSDLLVEPFNNVIDMIDKFNDNPRGLFSLVYHSDGCITGPSFLNHLAAAIPPRFNKERKPCVAIFGGREPNAWSWYCNHQMLHTNGIFKCCDNGGCWKARTHPMQKDPKHNKSLCQSTRKIDDRTVQSCMDVITEEDVIRSVEKYYEGDIYTYNKSKKNSSINKEIIKRLTDPKSYKDVPNEQIFLESNKKEINLLGNLHTSGGGEQSLITIAKMLGKRGWKVNLYPWKGIHENFKDLYKEGIFLKEEGFEGMADCMKSGLPLFFYGNDSVYSFSNSAQDIVNKSSAVIISINFINGTLPKCEWLDKTNKLKGIIFQNPEKRDDWKKQSYLFNDTKLLVYVGAINLDEMLEVCPPEVGKDKIFRILKHGKPDKRKYVTEETKNGGNKVHIWQKHFSKEISTKFYSRLLKDTKNTVFEFMTAPDELKNYFKNESRMIFYEWNSMSVSKFLSRGHLYLDHLSDNWSHSYPRTIGESMAAGLPIICEPRDGQMERVGRRYGDSGLLAIDYDEFMEGIKKFQRKEKWRQAVGRFNKDWARQNLRPEKWVDIIEDIIL